MKETGLKYVFYLLSAFLLFLMLLSSRHAGITCDDVLHYNQSVSVYKYFTTRGDDQSALNTSVTHLKYYGQSFDNLVTILIRWFNIKDVYAFRHLISSVAGWAVILLTALFAVWLAGYRAGILVVVLFAVSPTFMGHSQNNLKDIPFALGYIGSTFFTLKFLASARKNSVADIIFLTLSIAVSLSIRAGGLLLMCYLILFYILFYLYKYLKDRNIDIVEIKKKASWIVAVIVVSWVLSILLWPYAQQGPVKNVMESYRLMAHYPDTFRQIFEGKSEWSDFMPWYYLPKSMAITIPVVVLAGLVSFSVFSRSNSVHEKRIRYGLVIFTVIFPLLFVIYEKSNVYSSWRQFLFVYPAIVLLAATGFSYFFESIKGKFLNWGIVLFLAALSFHPLKFMIQNNSYSYLYYNQLVGGLKGAYGNFETDYYYVSQTEASKWLIDYLDKNKTDTVVKVMATYSVKWQFREHAEIETSYFRYEERSQYDWDYAIVANRYIPPFRLKNNTWPPPNTIHIVYADDVPLCAVIKRKSKDDYFGYVALNEGRNKDAITCFESALKDYDNDEMIFYNFAAALYKDGQYQRADSLLKLGLKVNPDFEPILMYLGNIARTQGKTEDAIRYYERLIEANRKYFEAYVGLSQLLSDSDIIRARVLLRSCLIMSPRYKPAIIALADTYRKSDPDIAKKYDELANRIK